MNRAHVSFGLLEKTQSGDFAVAKMIIFDYGRTLYDLVPNDETGNPDFTIHSLSELLKLQ